MVATRHIATSAGLIRKGCPVTGLPEDEMARLAARGLVGGTETDQEESKVEPVPETKPSPAARGRKAKAFQPSEDAGVLGVDAESCIE